MILTKIMFVTNKYRYTKKIGILSYFTGLSTK